MSLYKSVPRYYVCPAKFSDTFNLRQERFRDEFEDGNEHPNDLMAVSFTADQMRKIIADWFPDTDSSALSEVA